MQSQVTQESVGECINSSFHVNVNVLIFYTEIKTGRGKNKAIKMSLTLQNCALLQQHQSTVRAQLEK